MSKIERPSKEDRSKWDIKFTDDLKFGEKGENDLYNIIRNSTMEVKSDRKWKSTGNIAIEFECNGKPSGIAKTEADYYGINLCYGDAYWGHLVFPTDRMREIASTFRYCYGGDGGRAKMYLVKLAELFDVDKK
jgi:hypothetical protein|tara:strand:+ start:165 stop:563 length:399 start_codon:yes stop_codon:yes gene_type:complete